MITTNSLLLLPKQIGYSLKPTFLFLSISALALVLLLYFGTSTSLSPEYRKTANAKTQQTFDIQSFINNKRQELSPEKQAYLQQLDFAAEKQKDSNALKSLATFWKDSARVSPIAAYYYGLLANLVNSKKNLNFASQFYVECIRSENDPLLIEWGSDQAIALFDQGLRLDPEDTDLKIGRASCFIFGKSRSGDPQQAMQGILSLLEVVRKDSSNMKAQKMLGIGGFVSTQYDKAIARLEKVVAAQPDDVEAVVFLADSYAAKGDLKTAVKWYEVSKWLINDEHYDREVDKRIRELQKK